MITSRARILISYSNVRFLNYVKKAPAVTYKHGADQVEYLKSATDSKVEDWSTLKRNILERPGTVNDKNIDGVLLKVLVNEKKLDVADSFAEYLMKSGKDLNLGTINGLLNLYDRKEKLTDEEKAFILNTHGSLYKKYKVLDATTCERLLHALCTIGEWKKALKVLKDIYLSSSPSHSAYSTLIATLFNDNKKSEAFKLIEESLTNQRPLTYRAYESWIHYIQRKYKTNKTVEKYLNEILNHIEKNICVISEKTADKIRITYEELGWNAKTTKIRKEDGQCVYCKKSLALLKPSEEEFLLMQKHVKDRILVGKDLFLKSSPEELKRFTDFISKTGSFDVVLDALNISYAGGFGDRRVNYLTFVVDHFGRQNKKMLLLGRKHMLKWPKIDYVLSKTSYFFTENISQDDPYFITAAILSGSHTDFVSKDLLRGHRFLLQDELQHIFQRWQWQHQWMVFSSRTGKPLIRPPLPVTPCAQRGAGAWHLPFQREDALSAGQVRDGTPDWASWLCLQPPHTPR